MRGEMLTTRPAEEPDLPTLVHLLWDDEQGRTRESLLSDDYCRYLAAFQALKGDANVVLLVAVENEEVCGCLQLNILSGLSSRGMRRGLIEDVRVAQTHRRKGIGKLIMLDAVKYARANGCGMIELFVHDDRKAAHAFYEACGFEGKHRGYRQRLIND
jgi:ribosomal protein S18 acetylase RimI-like enzyme